MVATSSYRVKPRKSLAQHFLIDRHILSRIVTAAQLAPDDVVLEVGPGEGALTRRLVARAGRVVAVELDAGLAASLPERLGYPPNLTTVQADARTADFNALVGPGTPYKVVANLPYYAAKPVLRRFLEAEPKPRLLVVMVQREVADTILAGPGEMRLLSVAVQYYAVPSLVCTVPPSAFRPPPRVESAVLRLEPRPRPPAELGEASAFLALVRSGFAAPRKQLRNSLSQGLDLSSQEAGELLAAVELDGRRRAETLTLEEWGRLYRAWEERRGGANPGPR